MAEVRPPKRINLASVKDPKEQVQKIVEAINSNGDDYFKVIKSLDFNLNIKTFKTTREVEDGSEETFRHDLGYKPTIYMPFGDTRLERFEFISKNAKELNVKVILRNTFLTADVAASVDTYVANPQLFKAGDKLLFGSSTVPNTVKSVDNLTRKVVMTNVITATQFDLVRFVSENVNILII